MVTGLRRPVVAQNQWTDDGAWQGRRHRKVTDMRDERSMGGLWGGSFFFVCADHDIVYGNVDDDGAFERGVCERMFERKKTDYILSS